MNFKKIAIACSIAMFGLVNVDAMSAKFCNSRDTFAEQQRFEAQLAEVTDATEILQLIAARGDIDESIVTEARDLQQDFEAIRGVTGIEDLIDLDEDRIERLNLNFLDAVKCARIAALPDNLPDEAFNSCYGIADNANLGAQLKIILASTHLAPNANNVLTQAMTAVKNALDTSAEIIAPAHGTEDIQVDTVDHFNTDKDAKLGAETDQFSGESNSLGRYLSVLNKILIDAENGTAFDYMDEAVVPAFAQFIREMIYWSRADVLGIE